MATAPPLRSVVVDDTDPAIQYGAQGWFVANPSRLQAGNFGPIYNGTSTAASTDSTFSFLFNGTSIRVQGTIAVSTDANNVTDPTWTCTVDGIEINNPDPTFGSVENNWALCEQASMTLAPHNLTVQVKSKGQPFYFDSLLYKPLPDAFIQSAVLLYPDGDPALSYSPGWKHDGEQVAQTANTQVTLSFHGTSATLFGHIPIQYPFNATTASYTIDGGAPVTFPLKGLAPGTTSTQLNNILFTTPTLPDGPHNLTVIHGGDINHTPLVVKQFYVTNTTYLVSSVVSSQGPSAATQSATTPTGTGLKHPNAGLIAGGVVAGVLMLALLAAVYFWLLKRKRRDTAEFSASVYPVVMVDGAQSTNGTSRWNKGSGVLPSSVMDTSQPSRRKGAPPPLDLVLQHEDSGVRIDSGESSAAAPAVVELPPGYSLT
ncbi:hypothetical protein DFH09DRAFT_1029835 [Mycena vulgaris]|nr:hypothetical protein DFH09DRAFT_1029835 [Mycena vulgaris]